MKPKKPWLAALLNFVFPGLGYLYNGRRKVFSFLLLTAMLIGVFGDIKYLDLDKTNMAVLIVSGLLWFFAFAYDAYNEAKDLNKRLIKKK